MNTVEEVVKLSQALPLPDDYKRATQFYKALCVTRRGEVAESLSLLEKVAEDAPIHYRARALQSIGTILLFNTADKESASKILTEAFYVAQKHARDPFTGVKARIMLAVIKSTEGDHQGALDDLESFFPLARAVSLQHPQLYYEYLNSLAVELGEVGRFDEAFNTLNIPLSSSFAGAYFEWRETQDDLLLKSRRSSRSTIAFSQTVPSTQNVVSLPATQQTFSSSLTKFETSIPQQARVLRFQDYLKLARGVNDATDSSAGLQAPVRTKEAKLVDLRRMTTRQKLLRIMDLMSDDKITDDQLLKVLLILEDFTQEQNQDS